LRRNATKRSLMPAATGTLIIYAVIGVCVAAALALRDDGTPALRRAGAAAAALVFWPIFAPSLLGSSKPKSHTPEPAKSKDAPFSPRIRSAEEQLLAALTKVE